MTGAGGLWLRWVIANALGEMLGLGGVFAVGVWWAARYGAGQAGPPLIVLAVLVIVLACFEGVVVGAAQWLVLRRPLPDLSGGSWVGATVLGAVVAWLLGMIPSTLASLGEAPTTPADEPPRIVMFVLAVGMGAVAGIVLAAAQWWVLRRFVLRARRWLLANAIAWACAMPLIFGAVGVTVAHSPTAQGIALLALCIGGVGGLVGAIHGLVLVRLLSRRVVRPP